MVMFSFTYFFFCLFPCFCFLFFFFVINRKKAKEIQRNQKKPKEIQTNQKKFKETKEKTKTIFLYLYQTLDSDSAVVRGSVVVGLGVGSVVGWEESLKNSKEW